MDIERAFHVFFHAFFNGEFHGVRPNYWCFDEDVMKFE